jgi:hypothetical protein
MVRVIAIFWKWYYGQAINDILTGWRNFIIFSLEYFSIPLLLKTIIAPWRRDITRKPRGLDLKKLFEYISFNAISRTLGFIVRFFTIWVGILFFLAVIILGAAFFILWLALPLIIVGLFILALLLIF